MAKAVLIALLLLPATVRAQDMVRIPPDVARAHEWARGYRVALGSVANIWIGVSRAVPLVPKQPRAIAYTTRSEEGACYLTFSPGAIRERWVIAHETCHCVLDVGYLGPGGYYATTTEQEANRMEDRAKACQVWLMDDSWAGIRARASYRYPADWGLGRPRWADARRIP